MPIIKKNFKSLYILLPGVLLVVLLINSIFSAINLAVFYKVSSYNFMHYKDVLIQNINSINLNNSTPNPAPPSQFNYLGTDDRGRAVSYTHLTLPTTPYV